MCGDLPAVRLWFSLGLPGSSVGKESACNAGNPGSIPGLGKPTGEGLGSLTCWRRARLSTPVHLGSPCGSAGKESTCNAGNLVSILGLGRSPGEEKGYPLQCSGLENAMGCIVHAVGSHRGGYDCQQLVWCKNDSTKLHSVLLVLPLTQFKYALRHH